MSDDSRDKKATDETLAVDLCALVETDDRVYTLNGLAWDVANALDQLHPPASQAALPRARKNGRKNRK